MRALLKPQELYKLMVELLGDEAVSGSMAERALYEERHTPAPSITELWLQSRPDVIVRPGSTSEVARVVVTAAEQEIPMVPHGQGTWARGGAVPINGGIVIDSQRLNKIEVDPENLRVTVGAGVTWQALTEVMEKQDLLVPGAPPHAPYSTVGGWLSAGGHGYGGAPHIRSLTAVDPQGKVMTTGPALVQAGGVGYNLAQLLWGAEGTLGFISEATLGLVAAPAVRPVSWVVSDLASAAKLAAKLSRAGLGAYHIGFNDTQFARRLPGGEQLGEIDSMVATVFAGHPEVVAAQAAAAEKVMQEQKARPLEEEETLRMWSSRYQVPHEEQDYHRAGVLYLPVKRLATALSKLAELETKLDIPLLKHGGLVDPNTLTLSIWIPTTEPGRLKLVLLGLAKWLSDLAFEVEGVPAGLGIWTMSNLPRLHPPATLRYMREIKYALDPDELFNPGKLVEVYNRDDFPIPPLAINVGNEVVARMRSLLKR